LDKELEDLSLWHFGPAVTRMSYTATGQLETVTDANSNVTTNTYDTNDRLASVTDPLSRVNITDRPRWY
jgi:YD repeat-containing protein